MKKEIREGPVPLSHCIHKPHRRFAAGRMPKAPVLSPFNSSSMGSKAREVCVHMCVCIWPKSCPDNLIRDFFFFTLSLPVTTYRHHFAFFHFFQYVLPLNEDVLSLFPSLCSGSFYIFFSYLLVHIYKHFLVFKDVSAAGDSTEEKINVESSHIPLVGPVWEVVSLAGHFRLQKSLSGKGETRGTWISDSRVRDRVPQTRPGEDKQSPNQCLGLSLSTGSRGFWCTEAGGSVVVFSVPRRGLMFLNSKRVAGVVSGLQTREHNNAPVLSWSCHLPPALCRAPWMKRA